MSACPAGGEHTWTDDVGPEYEHLRRGPYSWRWHCDECGVTAPRDVEDVDDWQADRDRFGLL